MATPIAMPKLGMTMREGRVVAWAVAVGARVEAGAPVVVIESEKAEVEIEAPASGILRHVYVESDRTVPCGTLLGALTATADEPFDAEAFRRAHDRPEQPVAAPAGADGGESGAAGARRTPETSTEAAAGRARAAVTPAARSLARQAGLDPEAVPGTGPGGRVTREDVEAWIERRRGLIEVAPGIHLEVPAEGAGDAVLLLPGFGTDLAVFSRQVPALAARHRVLGIHPRGVGLSDAPAAQRYEVADLAADAAAVAANVAGGAAHVAGASLGAAVALEMALAHPQLVRSLVLITPFVTAGPRLVAVVDAWCRVAAAARADAVARMLLPWFFSASLLADATARERTARGLAEIVARVPAATLARTAAGLQTWSGARADALGRIAVPTLVVGGAEDLLTPDAAAVAAAIPGAACVIVPGAGHAVALEAPDAVNAAVLAHLAGVR